MHAANHPHHRAGDRAPDGEVYDRTSHRQGEHKHGESERTLVHRAFFDGIQLTMQIGGQLFFGFGQGRISLLGSRSQGANLVLRGLGKRAGGCRSVDPARIGQQLVEGESQAAGRLGAFARKARDSGDRFERCHSLPPILCRAIETGRVLHDHRVAEALDHALERSFRLLAALRGWKQSLGSGPQRRAGLAALELAQRGGEQVAEDEHTDAEPDLGCNVETTH